MPATTAPPSSAWRRFEWYQAAPVHAPHAALVPPHVPPHVGVKDVLCVVPTVLRPAPDAVVHPPAAASACATALAAQQAGVAPPDGFDPHAPPLAAAAASWPARAALATRGMLAVAYASGHIALLAPGSYQQILSFDAFGDGFGGRVTHLSPDAHGRLVALGEQAGVRFPLLRIWDLRQIVAEVHTTDDSDDNDAPLRPGDARAIPPHQTSRADLRPRLLAEARVQHGSRPTPVAALSHTPDLAFLSVGLADGTVLLLRGLSDALATVEHIAPTKRTSNGKAANKDKWDDTEPPLPLALLPKFKVILQQPTRASDAPLEPLTALALSVARDAEFDARSQAAPDQPKSGYVAREKKKNKTASAPPAAVVYMYIVTPTKLLRYLVQAPAGANYGRPTIVDDVGTALGCVALLPTTLNALSLLPQNGDPKPLVPTRSGLSEEHKSSQVASETVLRDTARAWRTRVGLAGKLVLARDEALYIAGGEGREACYALEGPKASALLTCDPNVLYRISASRPAGAAAATQHLVVWGPPKGAAGQEIALLQVFDLEAQAVAFTYRVPGGVRAAWVESAADPAAGEVKICVLSNTGSTLRLTQRPLRARTEALVRLALAPSVPASLGLPANDAPGPGGEFATALSTTRAYFLSLLQGGPGPRGEGDLAPRVSIINERAAHATLLRALGAAVPLIASLHAQYADSLYGRGEFDAATAQWSKAVGAVRPSHVIRKLLDSQRIGNLATYLAALHAQGLATPEHTTLLLNCYAKLKDVAALDAFIREPARAAARAARSTKVLKSKSKPVANGDGLFSPLPDGEEVLEEEEEAAQDARERERDTLPFDLATAIRVCRQGGFYAQAGYLAARYGDAGEYMRIQINDLEDWDAALVYARRSSPAQAGELLHSHARVLLLHRPIPTTTLLVELCAGHFVPGVLPLDAREMPAPDDTADDLDLSVPALAPPLPPDSQSKGLMSYLQLTSYLRARKAAPPSDSDQATSETDEAPSEHGASPAPPVQPPYPPPSPQTFFAHFAGMQDEFALFLESVALLRWGQQVDMVSDSPAEVEGGASLAPSESSGEDAQAHEAVWNTLLELCLSGTEEVAGLGLEPTGRRNRALRLLQQYKSLPYDVAQALLLCTASNFVPGLILLYARLELYGDLVHLFLRLSDESEDAEAADEAHAQLMKALEKWGAKAPHLYPLVLRHLVSSPVLLSKRSEDVAQILTVVEARSLLSPAEVVQLLAGPEGPEEGGAGIGLVRAYLVRSLTAAQEAAAADTALLQSYVAETRSKEQAAVSLTSSDSPAVLQATTCSMCGAPLSLPSTHFLCKHAYHSTCLATATTTPAATGAERGDSDDPGTECPICTQAAGVNAQIRRANLKAARAPQVLLDEVARADDSLAATARLFGMGLLGLEPPTAS